MRRIPITHHRYRVIIVVNGSIELLMKYDPIHKSVCSHTFRLEPVNHGFVGTGAIVRVSRIGVVSYLYNMAP